MTEKGKLEHYLGMQNLGTDGSITVFLFELSSCRYRKCVPTVGAPPIGTALPPLSRMSAPPWKSGPFRAA